MIKTFFQNVVIHKLCFRPARLTTTASNINTRRVETTPRLLNIAVIVVNRSLLFFLLLNLHVRLRSMVRISNDHAFNFF